MEDKLKKLILLMEIKNEEKFSSFNDSINQLDKQGIELSNDIDLVYKELSKIEGDIKSFNVSEQIKELKSDIENIQLQKGDKGDKGEDGKNGKDGVDGKDGRDGIDGLDGLNGKDGVDGKDGSPDTGEQIVEKINTLENVIEIKTIKDFPNIESTVAIKRQVETIGNQVLRLLSKQPQTVDLSAYVPTTRTLTINGTAYDLSADRSWSVGTVTSVAALTLGTSGTDLSSSVATGTTTPVITLNVPTASATNRGALSSTDWTTFNNKFTLPSLTAGSVLFSNGTTIAQDKTNFFWDNTNKRLGIGTTTPVTQFQVTGSVNTSYVGVTTGVGIQSNSSGSGLITAMAYTPADPVVGISNGANFGFNGSGNNFYGMGLAAIRNSAYDMWFQTGSVNGGGYRWYTGTTERMTMNKNGNIGIGTTSPTAKLHIAAGTASANTAPLKFESGTNLTTAEAGTMEYNGTSLFFTRSGTLRASILMTDLASPYNTYAPALKGATAFTTGNNNFLVGFEAGKSMTTGYDNFFAGFGAGITQATGYNNNFFGNGAGGGTLNSGTFDSNFMGKFAGNQTSASRVLSRSNVFGSYAAYSLTSNSFHANVFGESSGQYSGIHGANLIGRYTGYDCGLIEYSNFIGYEAGRGAASSTYANFIGYNAGRNSSTATDSIAIGTWAGAYTVTAIENIFIGKNAGYNVVPSTFTGDYNIAIGSGTLRANSTGAGNIAIGYLVGDTVTTGSKNVAIGYDIDYQSNTTDGQLTIQNAIFGTGNTGTGTTTSTGKIGIYTVAPTCALDVTGGIATSRVAVTAPATTDGNIFSGTYTPTLTGITNVTSSTAYVCQYMRVGNVVTVSGKVSVETTTNNTETTIGISLPIASNFANSEECGGAGYTMANTINGHGAAIYADPTNNRAEMDYFETHGGTDAFSFSFTYQII